MKFNQIDGMIQNNQSKNLSLVEVLSTHNHDHNDLDNKQGGDIDNHYHSDQPINKSDDVEFAGIKIPTGASLGKVLTSDADGVGTWETPSGGGGGSSYDQSLNTTDSVEFAGIKITTSPASGKVLTSDVDGVGTWETPSSGVSYDQSLNTTDSVEFADVNISGTLEITTGAGIGKVLTSDASGLASWETPIITNEWIYVILPSNYVRVITSIAYTDITGLSFSEISGDIYEVEMFISHTHTVLTSGVGYTSTFGAGLHTHSLFVATTVTATGQQNWDTSGSTGQGVSVQSVLPNGNLTTGKGLFMPTADGTWQLRIRSETASGTITIKAGSFIKYRKIN